MLTEKDLHDPVFEGVECDDCETRTRREVGRNLQKRTPQGTQFIIHMHAQGLKYTRRRVARPATRDDFADGIGELKRGFEGALVSDFHQMRGDLPGAGLLAILMKNGCQLGGLHGIHDLGSGLLRSRPHPHIERAILLK